MNRKSYASHIASRLSSERDRLTSEFHQTDRIPSTHIDNVLPEQEVMKAFHEFPASSSMQYQNTMRERKYTLKDVAPYPAIEEMLYAFQEPEVLQAVSKITGIGKLIPDPKLYAGGISRMEHGCFLGTHLDNSHDSKRENYRVLNLLFYITPNWSHESGGNFELWDNGPRTAPREIVSAFNRLLIMATHDTSWHSVNEVREKTAPRLCLSNYYFSPEPLNHPYFHVTSFRGRPEEPIKDMVLRADASLRMGVRKLVKGGIHTWQQERKE